MPASIFHFKFINTLFINKRPYMETSLSVSQVWHLNVITWLSQLWSWVQIYLIRTCGMQEIDVKPETLILFTPVIWPEQK